MRAAWCRSARRRSCCAHPADARVAELLATPRRQAEAVERLLAASGTRPDARAAALLPGYLTAHLQLSLVALFCVAIAMPLGISVARRRASSPCSASGLIQTIPGLALLAIVVPRWRRSGRSRARVGFELRSIGFLPALLALTLYAVLPILRNTVAGRRASSRRCSRRRAGSA